MAAASSLKDLPLLMVGVLIGAIALSIFHRSHSQPARSGTRLHQPPSQTMTIETTKESKDSEPQEHTSYLVVDVEGTCEPGKNFDYPNEIIEWPVVLLRWVGSKDGRRRLVVVDEFHSYVKPTFQPVLHEFCKELTGVTQEQVNNAPIFPDVLKRCQQWMTKHGIIDADGRALESYVWCSDGPWDFRDFFYKQAYISRLERPKWLHTRILDVRQAFGEWYAKKYLGKYNKGPRRHGTFSINTSYKLSKQLELLGLRFQGREHSGIDDSRNIARVLSELSARGVPLRPNLDVSSTRRFSWMGPNGGMLHNF